MTHLDARASAGRHRSSAARFGSTPAWPRGAVQGANAEVRISKPSQFDIPN